MKIGNAYHVTKIDTHNQGKYSFENRIEMQKKLTAAQDAKSAQC